jgi:hypothetical protein
MTLFITALSVGFLHTLMGPDHYVPFIVIGRARRWSFWHTSLWTFVCGLGHVLSSVLLGVLGLALGAALARIEGWEGTRGEWAGWALMLFGFGYAGWGVYRARKAASPASRPAEDESAQGRNKGPRHPHLHSCMGKHNAHSAVEWKHLTPWLLVLIFVLGPCEPLIPLFFASGLEQAWHEVLLVCLGYTLATLVGMHLMVTLFWFGLSKIDLGPLERWSHTLAGAVIALAGVSMVFLGL